VKLTDAKKKELEQISAVAKAMGFGGVDLLKYAEAYPEPPRYKRLDAEVLPNGQINLIIEKEDE
jgi:hypothetical protein